VKHLLFIGTIPPPVNGSTADNLNIVNNWQSSLLKFTFLNIPSYKSAGTDNTKAFTVRNVQSVLIGIYRLLLLLPQWHYSKVLFHLSQGTLGIIKECLIILILKIFTNSKIILRFPGGDFLKFYLKSNAVIQILIKLMFKAIDGLITEGETIINQFNQIDPSLVTEFVHIGTPQPNFDKINPCKEFDILYIANHREEKGFFDVLYSIKNIVEDYPKILFHFVGPLRFSSKEKLAINSYIKTVNISNNIIFHGPLYGQDKWEIFQRSTMQILPSYSEGMPTSLIEGLSFGLPIIASNVGVIPEIIKNEVNGLIIKPGDKKQLIHSIKELLKNDEVAKIISKTNKQYYAESFTINQFCSRLEKVIFSIN